jgi:hypothetical protein
MNRTSTGTDAAAAPVKKDTGKKTRCEEGGDEILAFRIVAHADDIVMVSIAVCQANARIRLWLTPIPNGIERLVIDETGKDGASAQLNPSLAPGEYLLRWSTLTPSDKWQTKTELSVGGTTRFRWRKHANSDNPVKGGTLLLVVG